MRKYLFLVVALLMATTLFAKTSWNFDPAHSSIGFDVDHMVIAEVQGKFTKFEGTFMSSKEDFSDAEISFKIEAASISTDNQKRDNHLKSPDFFDVAKYPTLEFSSTSLTKVAANKYQLKGDLTMHGVTKAVVLDVENGGLIQDPWGNTRTGFKLSGSVDRTDFGLKWNKVMEAGGLLVSEEVRITGRFELIKSK